jgi:hypothetical protein
MKFSKSIRDNMDFILDCINSSTKIDQLENCERMVNNFCVMNRENDKIPFVKVGLMTALALRERQLN